MKKVNFFGVVFCLLFIFVLFDGSAFAQSTDPDNPTILTRNELQGKNLKDKTLTYYYTFTAGPGTLKLTTDLKNGTPTGRLAILDWILLDSNFKVIKRVNAIYAENRSVQEVNLTKKQKVILQLEVGLNTGGFKMQLDGAVHFTSDNDEVQDLTADSPQTQQQQICIPRDGVVILTMNDGRKVRVDLSKVQKIDIQ
jgi:hypothetical protein